jgi:hypothetical protein
MLWVESSGFDALGSMLWVQCSGFNPLGSMLWVQYYMGSILWVQSYVGSMLLPPFPTVLPFSRSTLKSKTFLCSPLG